MIIINNTSLLLSLKQIVIKIIQLGTYTDVIWNFNEGPYLHGGAVKPMPDCASNIIEEAKII